MPREFRVDGVLWAVLPTETDLGYGLGAPPTPPPPAPEPLTEPAAPKPSRPYRALERVPQLLYVDPRGRARYARDPKT